MDKLAPMNLLLKLSTRIDALNRGIGKSIIWLVLIAVLVSAVNAVVRKAFNISSNAFLELQWVLFSAIFLFGAAYALQINEHVRIDILSNRLKARTRVLIELFGTVFFLLPIALLVVYLAWPIFVSAYQSGEVSANAGGLAVWPARLMVPAGFFLLALQGISQAIKCIGFLSGHSSDPVTCKR